VVPIGYVTLPNSQDGALVTIIIQIEQFDRSPPRWGAPNNPNTCCIPRKVVSPSFLTRIEDWYDVPCFWIMPLTAVATAFVAVSAR
jgi:hypothetical protein